MKSSSRFHNALLFLVFVGISTIFWFILALNDSAQDSFNVRIAINNVPDSVTFISDIPEKCHVALRDKGTVLWRTHYRHPAISINFKDYAGNGVLRFSRNDILTALKTTFGSNAQIVSVSIDSLHLDYTTNKGKRVPVVIESRISAASGSVIEGELKSSPSNVLVFAEREVLDTIHRVFTEPVVLSDLSETTTVETGLKKIRGAKIMPSKVKITVPVEPLVRKEALITITAVNVPHGESLLLFPSRVPVDYYVAMSRLGENDDPEIELQVDFNEIRSLINDKIKVRVSSYPERLKNLTLKTDSVEFTIVKN